jgi:hypothetical protein
MRTGFTFADIYDEVVSRTGGEQSTAEDVVRVKRSLRIVMERWEAAGYNTWRLRSFSSVASGLTGVVKLPENIDDIVEVTTYEGSTLTRLTPDRYMVLPKKTKQGLPSQYWLAREECPKLYLFPTGQPHSPNRLTIWYVERPAHFDVMRDNMDDVPGRWLEALILAVSHDFARKRPKEGGGYDENLISRLNSERLEAEDIARRADRDRVPFRYRIG